MVSAVKWEGASSKTTIMTTQLNNLGNNSVNSVDAVVVDNSTALNTFYWLELNVTFGSSPTDSAPSVDVYVAQAPDGTNYQSTPVTGGVDQGHLFVGSFPTRKVTDPQRLVIGPFPAPPHKFKVFVDNQTGVAFPASGSTLDIYTNNLEGQ